jgi:hypothetical protein
MKNKDKVARAMALQNSSQLTEIANVANKPLNPTNIKIYSESILGMGNFVTKLSTALSSTSNFTQAIYSGSMIGSALAEVADEIYIPVNQENSVKNSNKLTSWSTLSNTTVSQEILNDGNVWNKIFKSDTVQDSGVYTDNVLSCPVNNNGIFVSMDIFVPNGYQIYNFGINISNQSNSPSTNFIEKYYSGNSIPTNKKYRLFFIIDKSEISWAINGTDVYRLHIKFNFVGSVFPAGAVYVKNVCMAWNSYMYELYTPTSTEYATKQTSSWQSIPSNPYEDSYELAIVCYGRNDTVNNVNNKSHYLAYDKLISNIRRNTGGIIFLSPPPTYNIGTQSWDTDTYDSGANNYLNLFKMLSKKWNTGLDIYSIFKANSTPSTIMSDAYHQNGNGADIIVANIMDELKTRHLINNVNSELVGNVKLYLIGTPTGAWRKVTATSIEERKICSNNSYCLESSTLNDYLTFPSIKAQQFHLLTRDSFTAGSVSIIFDEGSVNEKVIPINIGIANDRLHGHFICDFGESGTHTIKVKITSNGSPIRIHGIVAI